MELNHYYPKEECGIVGLYGVEEAANFAYLGIYALQHRGQESAGIVSSNGEHLYRYANMGKVVDVFTEKKLRQLQGHAAIAHNRYSTTGASFLRNAQPIRMESRFGSMALAHNGNLTNAWVLRERLEKQGSIFQTTVDTEVICHLMARSEENDFTMALISALQQVKGAYSLVVLTKHALYAVRDPHGFRPLVLGRKNGGFVLASETCALDIIGAEYERDIMPGEFVRIDKTGFRSWFPFRKSGEHLCIFEFIYFSRPDSVVFRRPVYDVRYRLGEILAEEHPAKADVVIPVPDSSTVSALGFAQKSNIPFHMGLIRSHYIGRTFIEPDQKIRDFGAKLKYNAIRAVVQDKRVVIVDDSIMRGTTQRKIVKMLRQAGAKELHVRISSSPTKFPCYYGIDIPTSGELIASETDVDAIARYLEVDSLGYISQEGMRQAAGTSRGYCMACFNGEYPIPLEENTAYSNQKTLFEEYEVEEQK
ncbi:MAG: amidophosphoribosyltransferase [Candidatus Hydrogenedentota bacterium]|nr:MAG: amidophosphoribosyltransferase [Candidatus Hydrogenedentota bacterium]